MRRLYLLVDQLCETRMGAFFGFAGAAALSLPGGKALGLRQR
jgi:hypothetical protein